VRFHATETSHYHFWSFLPQQPLQQGHLEVKLLFIPPFKIGNCIKKEILALFWLGFYFSALSFVHSDMLERYTSPNGMQCQCRVTKMKLFNIYTNSYQSKHYKEKKKKKVDILLSLPLILF